MELYKMINENFSIGQIFNNPGKGTSTIVSITDMNITYKRGSSNIAIKHSDINKVYVEFRNRECSSNDLKELDESIFSSDSGGHSCNCTFLFLLLNHLNLSSEIMGRGVRGDSYYVDVY